MKNKKAFTIIELIFSMGIFFIISSILLNTIGYVINSTKNLDEENNIFENIRISLNFLEIQIRQSENIILYNYEDNTLKKLELNYLENNILQERFFEFDKFAKEKNPKFQMLDFGSNELAKHIENIKIYLDKENNILNIQIKSNLKNNNFVKQIDIKTKNIIEIKIKE